MKVIQEVLILLLSLLFSPYEAFYSLKRRSVAYYDKTPFWAHPGYSKGSGKADREMKNVNVQIFQPQRLDLDFDMLASSGNTDIILALKAFTDRATEKLKTRYAQQSFQIQYQNKKETFSFNYYLRLYTILMPKLHEMDATTLVESTYCLAAIYKSLFKWPSNELRANAQQENTRQAFRKNNDIVAEYITKGINKLANDAYLSSNRLHPIYLCKMMVCDASHSYTHL